MIVDQKDKKKRENTSSDLDSDATVPKVTKMDENCQISTNSAQGRSQPQIVDQVNYARISSVPSFNIVELAQNIEKANNFVKSRTCTKLKMIADQVQFLQKQAETILKEAKRDSMLHSISCNFVKQPGHMYHLYEKTNGQLYFSMLAPEEWGEMPSQQIHRGSYRLNDDQSWTPAQEIQRSDAQMRQINNVYQGHVPGQIFNRVFFLEPQNNNNPPNIYENMSNFYDFT